MFFRLLSVTDESTGITPMHTAAKNGRAEFIKAVILAGLNLQFSVVDAQGNSLYHYAAQANKETAEVKKNYLFQENITFSLTQYLLHLQLLIRLGFSNLLDSKHYQCQKFRGLHSTAFGLLVR